MQLKKHDSGAYQKSLDVSGNQLRPDMVASDPSKNKL